jgi:thiol-disulfide isomerase/thioredoxin
MKKVFLATILLYAGNMVAQNRSITFEKEGFDVSLSKAKSANKLLFIDCVTSWCGPCKQMSAYVFTKDSVADFFNASFVNLQLDMEKGEGPALAKEFHVEAYPTFLLLNSNRKVVYRFVGGMPADTFLAKIKKGMDPANKVAVLNERYEAGDRSKELLAEYIQIKLDGKEISVAEKIADDYFNMLSSKEKVLPENWFLFGENKYSLYLSNIHSRTFSYLANHWREFVQANGKETVESKLGNMYRKIAEHCLHGWYFKDRHGTALPYNKKEFDEYRKQIKSTELADKEELIVMMNIAQAAGEKDTAKLMNLMVHHIGNFSSENQKIAYPFISKFNASQIRTNPLLKQIIEAVIQSNKNESLVKFAKTLQ